MAEMCVNKIERGGRLCVCVPLKTNHTGGATTNPSRSNRFVVTVVLVIGV